MPTARELRAPGGQRRELDAPPADPELYFIFERGRPSNSVVRQARTTYVAWQLAGLCNVDGVPLGYSSVEVVAVCVIQRALRREAGK